MDNQFSTSVLLPYPLKTSVDLWFSDVFRVYRSGTLLENGFISEPKFANHHYKLTSVFGCIWERFRRTFFLVFITTGGHKTTKSHNELFFFCEKKDGGEGSWAKGLNIWEWEAKKIKQVGTREALKSKYLSSKKEYNTQRRKYVKTSRQTKKANYMYPASKLWWASYNSREKSKKYWKCNILYEQIFEFRLMYIVSYPPKIRGVFLFLKFGQRGGSWKNCSEIGGLVERGGSS